MAIDRERLQREINDITERYRAAGYFPSAVVRAFSSRETLASAWVGNAREDSVFDMASLTKIATATQVLRLISAGKLGLRDRIAARLPGVAEDVFLRERMKDITLFMLLTHTSTLPAWYPFYARRGEDFYGALRYALEHTEPTEGVVYSDLNFMLLGKLLARVQGKPLEACLREDLAEPLALGVMTYLPDPGLSIVPSCYDNAIEESMCAERGISFDGFRPHGAPVRGKVNDGNAWYYFGGVAGHAGIFANALAYERLCRYYMTSDDPLLIEAQREQPGAPGRGLGFQTGVSYPHGCGHTGFTGTGIYFSREYDVGVVSLTNRLFYPHPNENGTWEFRRALHEAVFALAGNRG
ncbi:MAG: beta-lactamase family protein [Clostridia bacterium]|nr:beta-lactamase family protein [Clostridia bacterium]